jgi:hypothetical protein
MKKIYLFILCAVFSTAAFSQDTTSFRMVGVNNNGTFDFFASDSSSMGDLDYSVFGEGNNNGHAIFVNPADGRLYAIIDTTDGVDRNLFSINPFTGEYTLVYDFADTHLSSGDIAANGKVYVISGNGSNDPGRIYELNLDSMIESTFFDVVFADDGSRALEYNPLDSSIFVFEGFQDTIHIMNINGTPAQTGLGTSGFEDASSGDPDEIHGAYFNESTGSFFVSAYGGELYTMNSTWNVATTYNHMDSGVTGNNVMDLTMFNIIESEEMTGFCPGDSVTLTSYYDGADSYQWYRNGTPLAGDTNIELTVMTAGTYELLVGIAMNQQTNYMWSEAIVVQAYTSPVVTLSAAGNDSLICPGDSIQLTGASGGGLQWYKNGVIIPGATSSTYQAMTVGTYNQTKTNLNGCTDSSSFGLTIHPDPLCGASIAENSAMDVKIYPNPSTGFFTIEINSNEPKEFTIVSILGAVVSKGTLVNGKTKVNISAEPAGVYFVQVDGSYFKVIK